MRILIVGGSAGIGMLLALQAARAGHAVTVLGRRADPGPLQGEPGIAYRRGDATDTATMRDAVRGQDAVCLCIGMGPRMKPVTAFSDAARAAIAAMREEGVRRILCVTGIGAGDSRGHGGFLYDRLFQPLLLGRIYADKDRQEALLRESGLDWTIVRPGFLNNEPPSGRWRAVTDMAGIRAHYVPRADVAAFLLQALEDGSWLRQAVFLDGGPQ
jgi:uncharacterized protein YbjT (DUF2867 family)